MKGLKGLVEGEVDCFLKWMVVQWTSVCNGGGGVK